MRAKTFFAAVCFLIFVLCVDEGVAVPATDNETTVILVRHAERADDDERDPSLTAAGEARGEALQQALSHASLDAIYVTQFQRTSLTAAATADEHQITKQRVEVNHEDLSAHVSEMKRILHDEHPGETVLIVGHSNTIPEIVNALAGHSFEEIDRETYDRIFIVRLRAEDKSDLIELRYGATSGD